MNNIYNYRNSKFKINKNISLNINKLNIKKSTNIYMFFIKNKKINTYKGLIISIHNSTPDFKIKVLLDSNIQNEKIYIFFNIYNNNVIYLKTNKYFIY